MKTKQGNENRNQANRPNVKISEAIEKSGGNGAAVALLDKPPVGETAPEVGPEMNQSTTVPGSEEVNANQMGQDLLKQLEHGVLPNARVMPSLDVTVKTVEHLYRVIQQRDNLKERLQGIELFEINLMEEADEMERNVYSGCKLQIVDSRGRKFETNTSNLIRKIADFTKDAMQTRLAEIEAEIVFPY